MKRLFLMGYFETAAASDQSPGPLRWRQTVLIDAWTAAANNESGFDGDRVEAILIAAFVVVPS
jgi:hypothetical protein